MLHPLFTCEMVHLHTTAFIYNMITFIYILCQSHLHMTVSFTCDNLHLHVIAFIYM